MWKLLEKIHKDETEVELRVSQTSRGIYVYTLVSNTTTTWLSGPLSSQGEMRRIDVFCVLIF